MIVRYTSSMLLAVLLVVGVAGCPGSGSGDIGATLPVAGKVTLDDKPLEDGNVTFHAWEEKGNKTKAGVSGIVKKGEYTVTSGTAAANANGAPPGWYKVTIAPGMAGNFQETKPSDNPKADLQKKSLDAPKASQSIAAKYTNLKETPLEVEVKAGGNYDLKVTSK